jgi:4-diphosphocytidyl-2-C-methyl-D-erythritol kinase
VTLDAEAGVTVTGFDEDTLVRGALTALAEAAGVEPCWHVHVDKRVPVAAGLGGGSADAAAALAAVNPELRSPLPRERLAEVAAEAGSDVPALLAGGGVLAEGAGERVRALELPTAYWIALALPHGAAKASTGEVYRRFDELGGGAGFAERREAVLGALETLREPRDFTSLPPNDLARAVGRPALLDSLCAAGAFRADVSGAGPAVYALFETREDAESAAATVAGQAGVWVTQPLC